LSRKFVLGLRCVVSRQREQQQPNSATIFIAFRGGAKFLYDLSKGWTDIEVMEEKKKEPIKMVTP